MEVNLKLYPKTIKGKGRKGTGRIISEEEALETDFYFIIERFSSEAWKGKQSERTTKPAYMKRKTIQYDKHDLEVLNTESSCAVRADILSVVPRVNPSIPLKKPTVTCKYFWKVPTYYFPVTYETMMDMAIDKYRFTVVFDLSGLRGVWFNGYGDSRTICEILLVNEKIKPKSHKGAYSIGTDNDDMALWHELGESLYNPY